MDIFIQDRLRQCLAEEKQIQISPVLDQNNIKPPELTREVHVSNLVLKIDARIKEIIDYAKMYQNDEAIPAEIIKTIIHKLEKI